MIVPLLILVSMIDLIVLLRLVRRFRMMRVEPAKLPPENDLPTVSVCIAARNEKHAMTQCLEHVIASEYPKLEVIVLDDGSRDNTSLLIKSFAHAGVRFVEGKPLPEGWLGKNYAQSILAKEASGKYVMFLDVDTLVTRHSVSRSVAQLIENKLKMISIIPMRNDHWQTSTLFTTMRHFWAIMRHSPASPRATANAWMIDRQTLVSEFAEDGSLPMSVKVETKIARKLGRTNEYRLLISDQWIGVRYEKKWSSQVETSIRVLYRQCHSRWYEVAGLIALLLLAFVPYVAVWFSAFAWIVIVAQYMIAYYYLSKVWARYRIIGAFLLPVTLIQEVILLIVSTYKYNFGTITWKGRPITSTK